MNDSADHCVVFLSLTCLHLWTSVHSWTQSYKFRDNTFFLLSYKETGWFWIQTYTLLPPGFDPNDIRINDRRHLPPPGTRSTGCQASSKELLSELLLLVASVGWKSITATGPTTRWHLRSGEKYEWSQKCHWLQNKTSPLDQAKHPAVFFLVSHSIFRKFHWRISACGRSALKVSLGCKDLATWIICIKPYDSSLIRKISRTPGVKTSPQPGTHI